MRLSTYIVASCSLALLAATKAAPESAPGGDAPLQHSAHLFGPGVISTQDAVANTSFTPDGKLVFFAKRNPGWAHNTIVFSRKAGDQWQEPRVASFSGLWTDADPSVSPDGKKLFFASNRPLEDSNTPRKDFDLWYVERRAGGAWGEPHHIEGPVNSDSSEASPSTTRDGTLYFESERDGQAHVYRSHYAVGHYTQPERIQFGDKGTERNPVIASDGSFLIFFSADRAGLGGADLFVSFHQANDTWSAPKNLGPKINSEFSESAPGLSPDNHTLYFSSDRIDGPATRTRRVTYAQLLQELHAIQNGLPKIYEVDISDIQSLKGAT